MDIKTINENELLSPYVDIAGIQWASCNLGASSPCECGDYYMWGSTKANETCKWEYVPFNNGSSFYNSSYFNSVKDAVCPNGILATEYDAIYQATDGAERIPTQAEFQSLYDNTTHEVYYCDTVLGHEGHIKVIGTLFTSIADTSKKIFIPFSGDRDGSSVNNMGLYTFLWSSTLCSNDTKYAHSLYCGKDGYIFPLNDSYRYYGYVLRGVRNNVKKE